MAGSCHSGPGAGQEQAEGTEAATCAGADHCGHGIGSRHPEFSVFPYKISVPSRATGGEGWWDQGPGGTAAQVWVSRVRLYLCPRPCLLSLKKCPGEGIMGQSLCVVRTAGGRHSLFQTPRPASSVVVPGPFYTLSPCPPGSLLPSGISWWMTWSPSSLLSQAWPSVWHKCSPPHWS